MRRLMGFDCEGAWCAATLDEGDKTTGLLIVSGGNEIRSGAHAGQAALAAHVAALGYPVFRYDRHGVGDSEGENRGFESSTADIAAAVTAFRAQAPHLQRIVAFGNCDAASALALFHNGLPIDRLVLANPWVIEVPNSENVSPPMPSAAIRARYWARLKNPRSLLDLLAGRIDLSKLIAGLKRAIGSEPPSGLAARIARSLESSRTPTDILLAQSDTTAVMFLTSWNDQSFRDVRARSNLAVRKIDSASHSFAGLMERQWLREQLERALSER